MNLNCDTSVVALAIIALTFPEGPGTSYRGRQMSHSEPSPLAILRRKQVEAQTGYSRSTLYLRISERLWPRPVRLGPRAVGWPAHEVQALTAARVAGFSDEEIRLLVNRLHAQRLQTVPAQPHA